MLILVLLAPVLQAKTVYVDLNGSHDTGNSFNSWAGAATSVNDAVGIAVAGDEVVVSNGYYRITNTVNLTDSISLYSVNGPAVTAIYRDSSDPRFRLLSISNSAAFVSGFTLTNGNLTGSAGAAVHMTGGILTNCIIAQCLNEASYGGSITMTGGRMTGCIVTNMSHWYPVVVLSGSALVEDSLFINSTCGEQGFCKISSDAVVRRCTFRRITGNTPYVAVLGGSLINSIIHSNNAAGPYLGPVGGVYINGGRMVNCTVANNWRTTGTASGVKRDSGVITNCIFYLNGAGAPADNYSGDHSAAWYSCSVDFTNGMQGNINSDPLFSDPLNGNYRIKTGSLCLDSGTNLTGVADDIDGSVRPLAADSRGTLRHDMGAYEKDGSKGPLEIGFSGAPLSGMNSVTSVFTAATAGTNTTITWWGWDFDGNGAYETNGSGLSTVTNVFGPGLQTVGVLVSNSFGDSAYSTNSSYVLVVAPDIYVSASGGSVLPYSSWANAATSINEAADIALTGCTIHITNGIYRLTRTVNLFKGAAIRSENGPDFTTVYRDTNYAVFGMFDLRDTGAALDGLTVTNGGLVARSVINMTAGTVTNCVITRNNMGQVDRGMIVMSGGTMNRCLIFSNNAFYGLGIFSGSMKVEDCQFISNTAGQYGFIQMSGGTMRRSTIASNTASYHTAGVTLSGGGRLENCLVYTNIAYSTGANGAGGIVMSGGSLVNCTIAGNVKYSAPATSAGGVVLTGGSITNCIIYGNHGDSLTSNYSGNAASCWYSCAPELTPAAQGNITDSPAFEDLTGTNLHLAAASPCVDAGTMAGWLDTDIDLENLPRIKQDIPDMGCFEWQPPAGLVLILR